MHTPHTHTHTHTEECKQTRKTRAAIGWAGSEPELDERYYETPNMTNILRTVFTRTSPLKWQPWSFTLKDRKHLYIFVDRSTNYKPRKPAKMRSRNAPRAEPSYTRCTHCTPDQHPALLPAEHRVSSGTLISRASLGEHCHLKILGGKSDSFVNFLNRKLRISPITFLM